MGDKFKMGLQLYLFDFLRKRFTKSIELIKNTYLNKISPVFGNIEEESDDFAEKKYIELETNFNPNYDDSSSFANAAKEAGLEYYECLALMKYNTKLMWILTLYQFWEQQVKRFIYVEGNRPHRFIDTKGNEVLYKDFCPRGFIDIKNEFIRFGQDLERLPCWIKINELRLLSNVIKHGNGRAAIQLKKLRPDLLDNNLLDIYKNTLDERILKINDNEFQIYCEAIVAFWNILPEKMYSND